MKLKKYDLNDPRWDKFCLESDDCWFWHTSDWLNYTMEYTIEDIELVSFFIEDGNNTILAICPLIREGNKFTFSGFFGPNPAIRNAISQNLSKKLLGQVFFHIDELAYQYGIKECRLSLSTLAKNNLSRFTYNYLMKYNYENVSLNTQILDLEKDKRTLWAEIKKSHRNEIKKGKQLFKFRIDSQNNEDKSTFEEFKKLHFLASGRMTRPEKTWMLQYDWKKKGKAVIILAYKEEIPVGGIYTFLYKNGAYYGSSANHP
ncbi:MAG: hypothetical protein ACFFBP_14105, partial [Promethearchaeota archaeon]